jgi:hypothetical protein
MLRMAYQCKDCGEVFAFLDPAQEHANETRHTLYISGEMTPSKPARKTEKETILAKKAAKDAAVIREAKKRGIGADKDVG